MKLLILLFILQQCLCIIQTPKNKKTVLLHTKNEEDESEAETEDESDSEGGDSGAFQGKYKFATDPRLPSYSPSMEVCCRSFLKICGSTTMIEKGKKGLYMSNPMQHSKFHCKVLTKPNKKKVLSCRMKSWYGNYYLNVDDDLKLYSNRFVVDSHHAFVQCKGRLIKIGQSKNTKASNSDGEEEKKTLLRKK